MSTSVWRWLLAPLFAVSCMAGFATPAMAAPYPPSAPTCSVTPDPVVTGANVILTCTGFDPGVIVKITSSGSGKIVNATVTTDANGGFSITEVAGAVGTATFIATSSDSSGQASTTVIAKPATVTPKSRTQVGAVSNSRPSANKTITFSGCGYKPGSTVTVTDTAGDSYGTSKVGANGCFHKDLAIPNPGEYTLVGTGRGSSGAALITTVHVSVLGESISGDSGAGAGLAFTGTDALGILVLSGVGLIAGGSALVSGSRRRGARFTSRST